MTAALFMGLAFVLVARGDPSKKDILDKAEGVETRDRLEDALGKPADVSKLGPIEKWTYDASDGSVIFVITGDSVAMQMTGDKREAN